MFVRSLAAELNRHVLQGKPAIVWALEAKKTPALSHQPAVIKFNFSFKKFFNFSLINFRDKKSHTKDSALYRKQSEDRVARGHNATQITPPITISLRV